MHGIVDVRKATESALWRQAGSLPEGQATELDMGTRQARCRRGRQPSLTWERLCKKCCRGGLEIALRARGVRPFPPSPVLLVESAVTSLSFEALPYCSGRDS